MSRVRDIANILSGGSSAIATDAEIPSYMAGKNAVINGAFDFWQRGTSIAFGNNYTADRWHGYHSAGLATMSRSTDKPVGFQYSLKAQRNPSATSTDVVYASYMMESADSYKFQGQSVTVSFYAKAGANYSAASSLLNISLRTTTSTNGNVISGPWDNSTNIISQNVTLTTSWQRFSYTGTVGSTVNQLAIVFGSYNSGTAGADDAYYITGVQLEQGSVATPFSRAGGDIEGELAACQRYFQTLPTATLLQGYNSSAAIFWWQPKNDMRTIPSVILSTTSPYWESVPYTTIGSLTGASLNATKLTPTGGTLVIAGTFSPTPVASYPTLLNGSVLTFSAEL